MADQFDQLFVEDSQEEEESIDIARYIGVLLKRKWLIIGITLLAAIPWGIYIKQQPPVYEAETIIRFKDYAGLDRSLLETRMTELNSRRFSEKVVQQLGLVLKIKKAKDSDIKVDRTQVFKEFSTIKDPKEGEYRLVFKDDGTYQIYAISAGDKVGKVILQGSIIEAQVLSQSANGFSFKFSERIHDLPREINFEITRFRYAVDAMLENKQVQLRGGGGPLLTLQMTGDNPVMVTKTVNRLAEIYKNESMNVKDIEAKRKIDILNERLTLAKDDFDAASSAMSEFQASYTGDFDYQLEEKLSEKSKLEGELEVYQQERTDLATMLDKLNAESKGNGNGYNRNLKYIYVSLTQLSTFKNDPEMTVLQQRLIDVEKQRDEIVAEFSEDNYQAKELEIKINATRDEIRTAANEHLNKLGREIGSTRQRLNSINVRMTSAPREKQRLAKLRSDWEMKRDTWKTLDTEYRDALMNQKVNSENIEIFQEAIVPEYPVNANKKQMAAIGGIAGLILGIAVAFALDFFDKSIKSVDDIKKYLKLQVLGTIPQIDFKGTDEYRDSEKIKQIDNQLVTHDYSPTPIGEAYRSLRTNLIFSKKTGRIHTLVITSTAPGDGKSFTSSNIAISMAQQRSNTLLIDADLRRGVLHNTFGIPKEPGFTNFLTNMESFTRIINETYVPNLSVISCGSLLPNPSELLGSLQMKRFLEQARRRYEMVIFDSPPLNAATDAVVIGTQVDGVVVVIRSGVTNRDVAKQKLEMFRNVPATILGIVLNGEETNLAHEGYSYYQY
ncbi:polysaccharide biosynthesis tyrosine autokinase [candidate division KSB1 bacterium]|nr:polysaccharide biosynthesis tyrosine autokinase [candidate division KSB1 bacterium]